VPPTLDTNPFVYSRPVSPEQMIDRGRELARMLELAEVGQAARLEAPRRYGKTTLLGRLAAEVEKRGLAAAYVDFSTVYSLADAAARIAAAYRGLQGSARRVAGEALRALRIGLSAGPLSASTSRGDGSAEAELIELLDLPLRIHRRTGSTTLVIFDEFQDLLSLREGLDGLVRSRIQHHGEAASYAFAGSRTSLLRELFADRERPLYGQAQPVELQPLPQDELAVYVSERFAGAGVDVEPILDTYLALVAGHPQRAMLVAHHLWRAAALGGDSLAVMDRAIEDAFAELEEPFEAAMQGLRPAERAVLVSLSGDRPSVYSRATLERLGLSKSQARRSILALEERGYLRAIGRGRWAFVDPLLAEWLRGSFSPGG
jgi:DNA-binding transcriptional ArsR family regulator